MKGGEKFSMRKLINYILLTLLLVGCTSKVESPPIEKEENSTKTVSLTLTGDLLFEQGLYDYWDNYQFGNYFDQIKPYLKGDLVIGNQEVPIGGEELGISGEAYVFNAPASIAPQLKDLGFDIFSLSNNHSNDMGYEGIVNTLSNLRDAGIETVGLYDNMEDSKKIKIMEANGVKIAFLAYTYDTNIPFDSTYNYATKTFLNDNLEFDSDHQEMLRTDIASAKQEADVVVVSMHWGNEFTYHINQTQIAATDVLNEAGVDLIIGNHPHCLQTMEVVTNNINDNETVVFYSLGNFVSSAAMVDRASIDFANMYEIGAIVNLDINYDSETKDVKIDNMVLTPTVNHFEHGYDNFSIIPFSKYTEDLASVHYQREYSDNFNVEWLQNQINQLYEGKITLSE